MVFGNIFMSVSCIISIKSQLKWYWCKERTDLMLYSLENKDLLVQVRDHGAELRSIKERADETEYLWRGDPTWWKYSAPLLFPIVGKLVDGKYRVNGKTYELPAHGLARIADFTLIEQEKDAIKLALSWAEE